MVWLPAGKALVVHSAFAATRAVVQIGLAPSLKVTTPVAVEGVTVAVKVTGCPTMIRLAEPTRAVLVGVNDPLKGSSAPSDGGVGRAKSAKSVPGAPVAVPAIR